MNKHHLTPEELDACDASNCFAYHADETGGIIPFDYVPRVITFLPPKAHHRHSPVRKTKFFFYERDPVSRDPYLTYGITVDHERNAIYKIGTFHNGCHPIHPGSYFLPSAIKKGFWCSREYVMRVLAGFIIHRKYCVTECR